MDSKLPATGTTEFLTLLSPYVPDNFINDLFPLRRGRGRRRQLSSAQLYRVHLLSVLTPVHAFNHLVRLLAEQRAWRCFAHLSNRQAVPDVWMLNQFREQCGVGGLRQINDHLLEPLLTQGMDQDLSLALIDATDLEASCSGHKKSAPDATRPSERRWGREHSRAGRVSSLWATRSTPSGYGCDAIGAAYCWCQ